MIVMTRTDHQGLYDALGTVDHKTEEATVLSGIIEHTDYSNYHGLYAYDEDGKLLGALQYHPVTGDEALYIPRLFVMPHAQQRGIGSTLIEAAKKAAKSLGRQSLSLFPLTDAIPFYKKNGFRSTSVKREMALAL